MQKINVNLLFILLFCSPLFAQAETRPDLMLCGSSSRPFNDIAHTAASYNQVTSCNPTTDTQAMLVTRDGTILGNGAAWLSYLNSGGVIITEWSIGTDVYNELYSTAYIRAATNTGDCHDNTMPFIKINPSHPFWQTNNTLAPPPANDEGCGRDIIAIVNGEAAVTALGGWDAGGVSLALRSQGAGKLWLLEADWQDNGPWYTDDSRGLMDALITSAVKTSYAPIGPQQNVPVATVTNNGWSECYRALYNENTDLATIQADCPGANLMLACSPTGGSTLQLLAQAPRADVLFDVGSGVTASHHANGSEWYYSSNRSWGFAPGGAAVNRNGCDFEGDNPDQRLCWHTSGGNVSSGYRCGSDIDLFNTTFERIIYQSNTVSNPGDCNSDGIINTLDVTCTINKALAP